MTHTAIVLAVVLLLPLLAASCAPVRRGVTAPPGKETVGAEAYFRWLSGCLDAIENDLPAITRSAEQAAAAYVQDGWEIGAYGDRGMVGEFNSRAGGMGRTSRPEAIEAADWKGIVLFFPREDMPADDLAKAREFRSQGRLVIGFGGPVIRQAARASGIEWDAFVDTRAADQGGLFPAAGGTWLVPTEPPASIAAVWTWTGEFVAALTRLGRMPPMAQSIMVPGAGERWQKYKGLKFHEQAPQQVGPGTLGRQYLAELRECLATVHREEMGRIVQVAGQAVATRRAGHKTHVFAHGHAIRDHVSVPHDTGCFNQVSQGLFTLRKDHGITPGDFVFCVGYDRIFQGWYFKDATERMRAAGASLAWSMTSYNQDPETGPAAAGEGEIVVGQHWQLGDAVVTVPGYDVKILPPSGVIAEAILRMTEAEVLAILGAPADDLR